MTITEREPQLNITGPDDSPADLISTPASVPVLDRHPSGLCAGRRNATAYGTGQANGANENTFSLTDWKPVYHRIADTPDRHPGARNTFAALHRALLAAGQLSPNAYAFLGILMTRSNNKAKAAHGPIWFWAEKLGWCVSTTKTARKECIELGLIERDNRRHQRDDGQVRSLGNRYGFTWTPELASHAGITEHTLTKFCGPPDVVWNHSIRRKMRTERRAQSKASGRIQAERGIVLRLVEDLITESRDYLEAETKVRQRYAGDPGLENFAIDHLDTQWPRYEATRYGHQIAQLDLSDHSKQDKIRERYGHREDLYELAMVPLTIPQRE